MQFLTLLHRTGTVSISHPLFVLNVGGWRLAVVGWLAVIVDKHFYVVYQYSKFKFTQNLTKTICPVFLPARCLFLVGILNYWYSDSYPRRNWNMEWLGCISPRHQNEQSPIWHTIKTHMRTQDTINATQMVLSLRLVLVLRSAHNLRHFKKMETLKQ